MLKKIVKYGNSSALVIDKALLELLNMAEGSVVKIKTDGVSLIITPKNAVEQATISPTISLEDTLDHAVKNQLNVSFDDPEIAQAYHEGLKEICERYRNNPGEEKNPLKMQEEMDALIKKYPPKGASKLDMNQAWREFAKVHEKYGHLQAAVMQLNENPDYLHEMMLLAEKHQASMHSEEYLTAYNQLIARYIPEYAAYQQELKKVAERMKEH